MEAEQQSPIAIKEQDGNPVLVLYGTIDITLAEQFHETARQLAEHGEDTAVGCVSLECIDLSALQILVTLKEELRARDKDLTFRQVTEVVVEQCELAGISRTLLPQMAAGGHSGQ